MTFPLLSPVLVETDQGARVRDHPLAAADQGHRVPLRLSRLLLLHLPAVALLDEHRHHARHHHLRHHSRGGFQRRNCGVAFQSYNKQFDLL